MAEPSYEKLNIQWYPGHMTKARRMIEENISLVDAVCEVLDARIPSASANPDIRRLSAGKPHLVILNRCDLADPSVTPLWRSAFESAGVSVLETDARSGKGVNAFVPAVRQLLSDKLRAYEEKGQVGRPLRIMILGIPNVGKSTLINKIAGRKAAIASDRPGVTRGKQWISLGEHMMMLDTPGILWPKFEDPKVGLNLAFCGSIKDEIMDLETLGMELIGVLARDYPDLLSVRYKLEEIAETPLENMENIASKRGFILPGKRIDYERTARTVIDEFRAGTIGRITLE